MKNILNRKIMILCSIASFLFILAVVTTSITFSFSKDDPNWNVVIDNVSGVTSSKIAGTTSFINTHFDSENKIIISLSVQNNGSYEVFLNDYDISVLNEDIKDYINIQLNYNEDEEIINNNKSNIQILINFKDNVPEHILKEYQKNKNVSINLNLDYQQKI